MPGRHRRSGRSLDLKTRNPVHTDVDGFNKLFLEIQYSKPKIITAC